MALFRKNDERYDEDEYLYEEEPEDDYDDGFDELEEEEPEELTEEEREERKQGRFRMALGAGNLVAVIGGAVLILVLLTLLFNMIYFVANDFSRNYSLFQTNF